MIRMTLFLFASIAGCVNSGIPASLKHAAKAYNYENYNKAIVLLSDYLEKSVDNRSEEAKYLRAVAFYYRGQARRGVLSGIDYRTISDYDESLKYRVCENNKVNVHLEQVIIDDYKAAVSLQPDFFYASFHLGLEQLISGDLNNAESSFASAWNAIGLNDLNNKRKLWVPRELQDYKRLIAYYYGMMLLRSENSCSLEMLRGVAILLSKEDGVFKDASILFDNVTMGKLTSLERRDVFADWYAERVVKIKDYYFRTMNEKRISLYLSNAKRFLNHYRAKQFRFIVDLINAYSRYDLRIMNMEVGDNFLIIRSLNDDQILQIKHNAEEKGYSRWNQVSDSASWQLTGLYGKQRVVVFKGACDLPIEYCVKPVAFNEKAVIVHSLSKNAIYCIVVMSPDDILGCSIE